MTVYSLVLTNGVVIELMKPWPGPDGKPFMIDVQVNGKVERQKLAGHVWQIVFVPDTVESFEDEDGNPIAETDPAHYKIFMRADGGGGLKNSSGGEETQAYKIYASQVLMEGEVYDWQEALQEIAELLGANVSADKKQNSAPVKNEKQAAGAVT